MSLRRTPHPSHQDSPSARVHPASQQVGSESSLTAESRPPQDLVQARLHSVIADSPQVQSALQFKAKVAQRMGPPVQLASAPTGGGQALPDGLKSGIEHLSGSSMDHVRVHYNSPRPAQLQAHAYAQGHHIHLAPGQAQYLPHEAWHVVQQQQGRVKPTLQLQGVAVNDQSSLEREADVMGARAKGMHSEGGTSARQSQPGSLGKAPVQCRVYEPYEAPPDKSDAYKAAESAAKDIDDQVTAARALALNWNALDTQSDKYLAQWAKSADTYAKNPTVQPKLLHARFGYAIESLASKAIKGKTLYGLTVHLQEAHGHTRPDIVLKKNNEPIAWLDITAEASSGHIFGKQGSGWSTKPYVAEIIYPSLVLTELVKQQNDPMVNHLAAYFGDKSAAEYGAFEHERYALQSQLLQHAEEKGYDLNGNQNTKRSETKDFLAELGMDMGKGQLQATKGALVHAKINPSIYGFKSGGANPVKQDIGPVKTFLENRAQPAILLRTHEINREQVHSIGPQLAKYKEHVHPARKWVETAAAKITESGRYATVVLEEAQQGTLSKELVSKFAAVVQAVSELVEAGIAMLQAIPLAYKIYPYQQPYLQSGVEQPVMAGLLIKQTLAKLDTNETPGEWRSSYFLLKKIADVIHDPAKILEAAQPKLQVGNDMEEDEKEEVDEGNFEDEA